jgi:hypothetical protein
MSISTTPPRQTRIPRLENGDHLTRDEFERRYDAMPELKKAELIEGVVYMPSPVRADQHGKQHARLNGWLLVYQGSTPGVEIATDSTVRLDLNNEPQPDSLLMIENHCGGQSRIDSDGYLDGGPELVAEVAASTVSIARNAKMQAYLRNGIREYILWRVEDAAIDWFVLRGEQYELLPLTGGLYRSEVFPGLWMDPEAMIRLDTAAILAVLQQGIASPEHAAFVVCLQQAAQGQP